MVETLRLLAGAEFDRGHWRDAYAAAAEAVELAEEIGLPRDACAALGILAEVDAGAGNGLACAEHAARAIELGAEFDLGFYRARAERASGQLALATGRHEEAAAELERVWKEQLETGSQEWSVTPVFDLIEALTSGSAEREEARDVLVRARAELPPESPVEQGIFDRCAALLEEDFEPLFDRALASARSSRSSSTSSPSSALACGSPTARDCAAPAGGARRARSSKRRTRRSRRSARARGPSRRRPSFGRAELDVGPETSRVST